jgi:hypothetical protein
MARWHHVVSRLVRPHSGDGVEVHVDPAGVTEESEADLILLTHPHFDNFSEDDIAKVRGPNTVVVAPSTMKKQLADADHFMRPGDMLQLDGFDILAVPAHNVTRSSTPGRRLARVRLHRGGTTFYHAGDTDFLPSMAGIRCDIAFLPVRRPLHDDRRGRSQGRARRAAPRYWCRSTGASRTVPEPTSTGSRRCSLGRSIAGGARAGRPRKEPDGVRREPEGNA